MGNMYWDCQYWSVQQCVPNVLAGTEPEFCPEVSNGSKALRYYCAHLTNAHNW